MIRRFSLGLLLGILILSTTGFATYRDTFNTPVGSKNLRAFLIENTGQFPEDVRFMYQSASGITWFTEDVIWLTFLNPVSINTSSTRQLGGVHLKMSFHGANPDVRLEPQLKQEMRVSFLTGAEPDTWHQALPVWGGLRYVDLYPGIDLVLKPKGLAGGFFDWSFEVDKSVDPSSIRLELVGVQEVARGGNKLSLTTDMGDLSLALPSINTPDDSTLMNMNQLSMDNYVYHTGVQTYEVYQPYSLTSGLFEQPDQVISDGLWYSTYLGGSDWEDAYGLAVDSFGYAYVTGRTPSTDFPVTPGAFQMDARSLEVFVAKLLPDGSALEYATFIGGSGQDSAYDIAVEDGIAYVVGNTWSPDFPLAGDLAGENDAFVFALNPAGTDLIYTTLLGGEDQDFGNAIAVEAGNAYLTGTTLSLDFPADGYQRLGDAFVAQLNEEGELRYASILGGREDEAGLDITVQEGEAFVTGQTWSIDFPGGGFKGNGDAFVAGFDPDGELHFASIVAGVGEDRGTGIIVDENGNSIISGSTGSPDFPAPINSYRGGQDAFLASFNQAGELQSTILFGGSKNDSGNGLTSDISGNVYLVGQTDSANLPVTQGAYQSLLVGGYDAFMAQYRLGEGFEKVEATYLGGSANDQANAVASDVAGNVYLAGSTESEDFPLSDGALSKALSGSQDAFVSRFGSYLLSPPSTIIPTTRIPTPRSTSTPLATLPINQATVTDTSQAPQVGTTPLLEGTQLPEQTREGVKATTPVEIPTNTPEAIFTTEIAPSITSEASIESELIPETPSKYEPNTNIQDFSIEDNSNYIWFILPIVLSIVVILLVVYRRRTTK